MTPPTASGPKPDNDKSPGYRFFFFTAGVCFAIAFGVFGTMLLASQRIPTDSQQSYFLVAFALATAASLILIGVLKSGGHSKGKLFGFDVTLGAPATIFFGVLLAAYLFDQPDVLYADVSLQRPDHTYISEGKILIHNENGCRSEDLIRGNRAVFALPLICRGTITIDTDTDGFEPANPIVPFKRTIVLQMVPVQANCSHVGRLFDSKGTAIPSATIWAGVWNNFATTSDAGQFTLRVPRKCGSSVSLTIKLSSGKLFYKDEIPLNGDDGHPQNMVVGK